MCPTGKNKLMFRGIIGERFVGKSKMLVKGLVVWMSEAGAPLETGENRDLW